GIARTRERRRKEAGRLLSREGQDDGVESENPGLLAVDVEVMALDLFGGLLEGHDRLDRRHVAEGVGALVETVAAARHDTVADRGSLRAVDAHAGGRLFEELDEDVDAVDLAR